MDTWSTLIASSTVQSGTAYDHISSLTSVGNESILLVDSMHLDLDTQAVNVVVSDTEEFNITIDDGQLYLNVEIEFVELPL